MSDYTSIVILCEDRQQEVFARTFLTSCGVNQRRIRPRICPKGVMAGEQYVRLNYPVEVDYYRRNRNRLQGSLVVMIDADTKTVKQTKSELDQELVRQNKYRRQADENIGIYVPKRNIETWIHFLMGETVNEEDEYQKYKNEGICKPKVEDLARNRRNPLPDDVPPSMHAACDELDRIL